MEDLKIIFYLLVAVAWLIMRNYKKARQNKPEITEMDSPPEPEILYPEPPLVKPLPVRPAAQRAPAFRKREPKPVKNTGNYEFGAIDQEGKAVSEFFKKQRKAEAEATEQPDIKEMQPDPIHAGNLDLRTAILHAEILKRPEYWTSN